MIDSRKPMCPADRRTWLIDFSVTTKNDLITKFEAGQVQHSGDLGEVPVNKLVEEIQCEALDQLAYVAELKRRLPLYANEVTRDMLALKNYINSARSTGMFTPGESTKVDEIFTKYL